MQDLRTMHQEMAAPGYAHTAKAHDDWENWTDDDDNDNDNTNKPVVTSPANGNPFVQIHSSTNPRATKTYASAKSRLSNPNKILRLKSRKRQKAQNERAGIKLVTDLTRFRKGPQQVAQLVQPAANAMSSETAIKFVDPGALRALEGSPNPASMGNWAWLHGGQSPASAATPTAHHRDESKILIGMSVSQENGLMISPHTAVVATPSNTLPTFPIPPTTTKTSAQDHSKSAWSPDTEDGLSPARYLNNNNINIYAQPTGPVPPVPPVPSPFVKNATKERLARSEIDDDDDYTPVTLFEEDGKSPASAVSKISPATTRSAPSGWWDHVKTPFKERLSPVIGKSDKATASPTVAADEWWKSADEKKSMPFATGDSSSSSSSTLHPVVPVLRVPTPTTASSSRSSPPPSSSSSSSSTQPSEKARAVMEEHADPSDVPPPYEQTPSEKNNAAQATTRYHALFPAGHPLATQFPPSPMPASPAQDAHMDAKGAIRMADVPLTPADTTAWQPSLPDRVAGTYVTGEQFRDIGGASSLSPAAQIEKTRRRHEKEDYLARKAGGFWKGRGCLPQDGCYGRSGREGRKRRRVWLGVCLALLLLTVLGVVLGVVLGRKLSTASHASSSAGAGSDSSSSSSSSGSESGSDGQTASSVWLNLTDFPPIPTGLATIVGADNSLAVSGCVEPASLWSCSLPPEQQAANEPQDANQPAFIFQIQYDNNTRQLWDIPNGDAPTPDATTAATAKATATKATQTLSTVTVASGTATTTTTAEASNDNEGSDLTRRDTGTTLYDTGIAPNPDPPSYEEMWFLGNWTDDIVADDKAGEPTPFYISFFTSLDDGSAGPNMLTDDSSTTTTTNEKNKKRGDIGSGSDNGENVTDTLPLPPLNADGSGAAAQLRPFPYQQPLRLYDRGLATEHYGFYTYFNKTIYLSSVDNSSSSSDGGEGGGGVRESSAAWYATWTQTRFLVKIWTKKQSATGARLISGSGSNATTPGSFPYPVTLGEDTHGGDLSLKNTFAYGVEADQRVNTSQAVSFTNNIGYGAASGRGVVNPRLPDGDLSWGGVDGGRGGCRCEWVNWVEADGTTDGSLG